MKILLVSSAVLPVPCAGYGGLEKVVFDCAVELNKKGHKVSVVAPSYSKLPEGIEFIDAGKPGEIDENHLWGKVGERVNNFDFDIVHEHSWSKIGYLFKKNNPKIKLCATLHGMTPYNSPPPVTFPNMIALSKSHAMEVAGVLGINCKWVWNGIDTDFYQFQEKKGDRLLWLGRFMIGKGAHIAIDVARNLNTPIDLVGDDTMVENQDYVRRIMKMASESNGLVRYWGPVPRERAVEFFKNAKAFLQCGNGTWHEPFGLVTIESLACGTPVVALRNGATTEILEKLNEKKLDKDRVGILCNDVKEMIAAVPEAVKLDPKNCRTAAEGCSAKLMADNYEQLYKEIISGKEW